MPGEAAAVESFSTIGIRKASVFPVPVRAGGIDFACTGVGSAKRFRARFWCRQGVSVSSTNFFIKDEMCRYRRPSLMNQTEVYQIAAKRFNDRLGEGRMRAE